MVAKSKWDKRKKEAQISPGTQGFASNVCLGGRDLTIKEIFVGFGGGGCKQLELTET